MSWLRRLILPFLVLGLVTPARAEVSEVRIAQQFGLTYLPLIVIRAEGLIEKRAEALGIGPLKVTWARFGGGAPSNDALLSGSVDYISTGLGPFLTLWDRTRGNLGVKGVGALDASSVLLNTNNPDVKSIADLTDRDRIALPSVKVSHQAVLLQMAAEQKYGFDQYARFDRLTVGLPHPEALAALLSGKTEITGHFGNAPFVYQELQKPGIRTILTSDEVLGGPSTVTSLFTTSKFRDANPKVYRAVFEALAEAQALIARDKALAARLYVAEEKSALSAAEIQAILERPDTRYTLTPLATGKFADFMHRTGALKTRPASWRDYYFPEIHELEGS